MAGLAATADGGDVDSREVSSREGRGKADRRCDEGGEGDEDRVDGGGEGVGRGGEGWATKVMVVGVRMMRVARMVMAAKAEEAREWRLPIFLHFNSTKFILSSLMGGHKPPSLSTPPLPWGRNHPFSWHA